MICRALIKGTSLNEMCDNYGSRISGTGSGKVLAWRSLMMITVIELIFAASCCLLSLECVLLTQRQGSADGQLGIF